MSCCLYITVMVDTCHMSVGCFSLVQTTKSLTVSRAGHEHDLMRLTPTAIVDILKAADILGMRAVHDENCLQCSPMSQRNERRAAVTSMFYRWTLRAGRQKRCMTRNITQASVEWTQRRIVGVVVGGYKVSRGISEAPIYGVTREFNSVLINK